MAAQRDFIPTHYVQIGILNPQIIPTKGPQQLPPTPKSVPILQRGTAGYKEVKQFVYIHTLTVIVSS